MADVDLQDEPLQVRVMDYDTYSANDLIGKVYFNLNPLLLGSNAEIRSILRPNQSSPGKFLEKTIHQPETLEVNVEKFHFPHFSFQSTDGTLVFTFNKNINVQKWKVEICLIYPSLFINFRRH